MLHLIMDHRVPCMYPTSARKRWGLTSLHHLGEHNVRQENSVGNLFLWISCSSSIHENFFPQISLINVMQSVSNL